ncbi:MAG: outer membrane protein assembly factor BamB [Halioglobus sp.]|jgi:outer membrane protein assembly factor BamB
MKQTMNILITILFTTLFWACEKSDLPIDPPVEVIEDLEIEWATRLDFDKEIVGTDNTQHYKEWVIVGGDINDPPTLLAFNKDTGEKDWELIFDEFPDGKINLSKIFNNNYIAQTGRRVFGIDLDSKAILWQKNFHEMNINLGRGVIASNGMYYQVGTWNFNPSGGGVAHMYEIDPYSGDYNQVYAKAPDSIGTTTVSPPVVWEDTENGRSLLIFNERPNAELSPPLTSQYLVSINLTTKERVWETKVTNEFASNGLHPPIIYDNRIVITGGHNSIYGFDINTGAKLWAYEDENSLGLAQWGKTNHLIHDNRLYVNETGEDVSCLDPETGTLIWDNIKGGANCTDNMHYYEKEDLLVFTSWGYGSVMVLDALTGETLHREIQYDNSPYNSDVVYDEERDLFMTSTYKHAVAFKVRRTE